MGKIHKMHYYIDTEVSTPILLLVWLANGVTLLDTVTHKPMNEDAEISVLKPERL